MASTLHRNLPLQLLLLTALLGIGAGPALADEAASDERLVLPKGQLLLQATLDINLTKDVAFKPVSIAPDLWYGATDDLTVGLTHSRHAGDGFFGGPGAGLCFTGEDNGCANILNNTSLAARYHLPVSAVVLAFDGGLAFRSFSPFQMALKLGVIGKWNTGKISLLFGVNFFAGLTNREPDPVEDPGAGINKEVINVPLTFMYTLSEKLGVGAQTGVGLPLSNTGDTYFIPLALGARYMVTPRANVDLTFALPFLISGAPINGVDVRVLSLAGGYAF